MRPEKLIIEGIYSYRNRTEIDFSTLCKADLFGIFGSVGSGKSAVLEAVTYVLYGRIERLSSKMMNYNMMNLSANRMYIDFIFAQKGKKYRFTFEAKRNKKDFEKIETPRRGGYVMEGGQWIPLFDKDGLVTADEITGLNYDNFRRTVIVPQGKFQEFLHLEKAKRTEMLMDLFNLNRFDLYAGAAALSSRNTEKAATIEGALSGLQDADNEAVAAAGREIDSVEGRLAENSGQIEKSDAALRVHEELAGLTAELSAAGMELVKKQSEAAGIEERKAALREYEDCRSLFETQLKMHTMLSADYGAALCQLEAAVKLQETGKSNLIRAEAAHAELERENKKIDEYRKQALWFDELAGIEKDRDSLGRLERSIRQEQDGADAARLKKENTAEKLEALKNSIAELDKAGLSVELMTGLQSLYDAIAGSDKFIRSEKEKLLILEQEIGRVQSAAEGLGGLDDAEAAFEKRENEYRKMLLDAELSKGIERLAEQLEEGKACPLCGSLEHPAPASGVNKHQESLATEEEALGAEKRRIKRIREQLSSLKAESAALAGRITSSKGQIEDRESEKKILIDQFPECRFSPDKPDVFTEEYNRFIAAQRRRGELQSEFSRESSAQEKLAEQLNHYTETVNRLKLDEAKTHTRITETELHIDKEFLRANEGRTSEELSGEAEVIRERISSISAGYAESEDIIKNSAMENERNSSAVDVLEKRVKELSEKKEAAETGLNQQLESSGYDSLMQVSEILASKIDTAAERSSIEGFEKEYSAVTNRIDAVKAGIGGRSYDSKAHFSEKEENGELKKEQELLMNRLGELRNVLKDLTQRLKRREELEKELSALKTRGENINTLKNLFKGKKFIDYAATIYLRELCEAANMRFRKLTRESLRLELDETNNFIIRDYLNEGKTRSVKTLSGGQTFQAAFSLSLALADSLGRERSGFFFLDEGFGSLDRESLLLVFESLKTLRKEERTVGVISHVEELKQEIDTFITVKKTGDEGSLITNSWES